VLRISSSVKNHWLLGGFVGVLGADCAGDGAAFRGIVRGGDVREEWEGGDGTAGGTSRRRVGDREWRSTGGGFGGSEGGWYPSRGGRYLSMLAMLVVYEGDISTASSRL